MPQVNVLDVVAQWAAFYRPWLDGALAKEWTVARKAWAKTFFPDERVWNQPRMWPDEAAVQRSLATGEPLGATAVLADGVQSVTDRIGRGDLRPSGNDLGLHAGTWAVNEELAARIARRALEPAEPADGESK